MMNDKTDIEIVKSRLNDMVELWCTLNALKNDPNSLMIMNEISAVIDKRVLLKRWCELHLHKTGPFIEEQIPFSDDADYMEQRKKIISKLLV